MTVPPSGGQNSAYRSGCQLLPARATPPCLMRLKALFESLGAFPGITFSDQERKLTMSSAPAAVTTRAPQRWAVWLGRVLSAIPVLLFVITGAFSFTRAPAVTEGMAKYGYPESTIILVAGLEIGSALIYAFPRTAFLGAILMTGYLGGAVATHVRVGDGGYPMALIMGIFVWTGLYLRDQRLRALLPWRRTDAPQHRVESRPAA
jgi:DoxX-like family